MNNFDGIVKLYPEICVDNFITNVILNKRIKIFILSHFHDDHMHGLEDFQYYKLLKTNHEHFGSNDVNRAKFYCSAITKEFIGLCDKYKHLYEYCTELSCDSPISVSLNSEEIITITFVGSGHCPGSVMVFIEGSRGNILFTGDFRLPLHSASRLKFLKLSRCENEKQALQKSVHTLYIDMTFFKPSIKSIPSREESVCELIRFIKSLSLSKTEFLSEKKFVYLKSSARIGYEYVYQEIFKQTGFKIHVNETIYRLYDKLPQIQTVLTLDPFETPIHSCMYEAKKRDENKKSLFKSPLKKQNSKSWLNLPCTATDASDFDRIKASLNCIKIILSTMWFIDTAGISKILVQYIPHQNEADSIAYKPYKTVYRLCFSFHSSYEEIVDFVETIKPLNLKVIALPEVTTECDVNEFFYGKCNDASTKDTTKPSFSSSGSVAKTLVLRKRKSCLFSDAKSNHSTTDDESGDSDDGLCFGDVDKRIKK